MGIITLSENKRRLAQIALSTLCIAVALFIFAAGSFGPSTREQALASGDSRALTLDGNTILVAIADTYKERERGLGGRTSLAPNSGMLFIFPKEGKYAFWMKGMHFSIDIVWLANDGSIIDIKENISPDTFPASFAPPSPARYVLELPAGYVKAHGIQIGDKAVL